MTQPKSHGSKTDRLKGHGLSVWTALGFHLIDDISREISSHRIALFQKFCYLISKLFFGFRQRKKSDKLMSVAALLKDKFALLKVAC